MIAPAEPQAPPAHDVILRLTDTFCHARLTEEYALLCRKLVGELAQTSLLTRGKPEVWACAILRVIGRVNFLDLDTGRRPFMKLAAIDKLFGVSSATAQGKAKTIRDMLKIRSFDLDWTLPSLRDDPGLRERLLSYSPEYFDILEREE